MILQKNQIERYLRHIIMPEISGPGQKKLLESRVFIYGDNVKNISALIYYLAASGIGNILCTLASPHGFDELALNIKDLNEDVILKLSDSHTYEDCAAANHSEDDILSIRIVLGNYTSVINNLTVFTQNLNKDKFIPTIAAIHSSWNGFFHTFLSYDQAESFLYSTKIKNSDYDSISPNNPLQSIEDVLTTGFLGTLSAIACIKICLNIGEIPEDPLFVNLLLMEFSNIKSNELCTYMHKILSVGQTQEGLLTGLDSNAINSLGLYKETLSKSKVLIIGAGGLGSPVAFALSYCGIGTLGIVDYDRVEISNLNRQILHSKSRIGMEKVKSAEKFIKSINPDIEVVTYTSGFTKENALNIIKDFDIVIDGVDNLPARYLINDACYFGKKPFVEAGVIRFDGLSTTIIPDKSACYRCLFQGDPNTKRARSCAETGVLGPVPGLMGFIEAAETVKLLINKGQSLQNKLIYFSGEDMEFTTINSDKEPNCPLCGTNPSLKQLGEYEFSCESSSQSLG